MAITSINPANGETLQTYEEITPDEAANTVDETHAAWQQWRTTSFADRARLMKKAAAMLRPSLIPPRKVS